MESKAVKQVCRIEKYLEEGSDGITAVFKAKPFGSTKSGDYCFFVVKRSNESGTTEQEYQELDARIRSRIHNEGAVIMALYGNPYVVQLQCPPFDLVRFSYIVTGSSVGAISSTINNSWGCTQRKSTSNGVADYRRTHNTFQDSQSGMQAITVVCHQSSRFGFSVSSRFKLDAAPESLSLSVSRYRMLDPILTLPSHIGYVGMAASRPPGLLVVVVIIFPENEVLDM